MKLRDIVEMDLNDALAKTMGYGQEQQRAADKRDRQMKGLQNQSRDFKTYAADLVAGWPNISLDDFIDELEQVAKHGDEQVHYFTQEDWERAYAQAITAYKEEKTRGIGNVA